MNKLSLLQYFYIVAQTGSVSKGAKELGITQPTVTKMIKELEEIKDQVLFNRSARGVSLTQDGQALLKECKELFEITDNIFSSNSVVKTKKLRIGSEDFIASSLCKKELKQLRETFIGVEIELVIGPTDDLYIKLQRGELDFVLSFYNARLKGIFTDRLKTFKQILVGRKKIIKTQQYSFIGQRQINTKQNKNLPTIKFLRDEGYEIKTDISCNSLLFTLNYLVENDGLSLMPEVMVKESIKEKKLLHLLKSYQFDSTLKISYTGDSPSRVLDFFKAG